MTMKEAMAARHTVRRYTARPLEGETLQRLEERIAQNNQTHGLQLRLVTENAQALPAVIRLTMAKNVRNYIVLAGPPSDTLEESIGWCGADLMLYAQTLGLNSWWIGGTYSRGAAQAAAGLEPGVRVLGVLAVGYGQTQGTPHKSKQAGEISAYQGQPPQWFTEGVNALLLAPTALNKQAFAVRGEGNTVTLHCNSGIFSGVDLGIGRYHFELGAGRENFCWG